MSIPLKRQIPSIADVRESNLAQNEADEYYCEY